MSYLELLAEKSKILNTPKKKQIQDDDNRHKLSYAFQNLNQIPQLPESCSSILTLDLTENNFTGSSDLKFLIEFTRLKTLILDKNQIQSNIRLPLLETLTTLWVNHNKIENLSIFIQNVSESCPNLTYLSMINNKAAPSYFNGGSLNEYNDYRLYVISKLKKLTILDDKEVTPEERTQSGSFYGKIRTASIRKNKKKEKRSDESELYKQDLVNILPDVVPIFESPYDEIPPDLPEVE